MIKPFCTDLGVGVGLRNVHQHTFLNEKPKTVSWVEVISENYMPWRDGSFGNNLKTLLKIRENYPVVLHGVSMSIGSCSPLNKEYLANLKKLIDVIEPKWISDHLCWTGLNGQNLHDLIPLPYTEESERLVVNNINRVQDFLDKKILLENPSSYFEFKQSTMTEWQFLNNIIRQTGCGLLLDINNVYVSSVNHSFDPIEYLQEIDPRHIGQIHLAGHSDMGTHLIDTHDTPVCEEVWELYKWSVQNHGLISAMIERDANIPAWEVLEAEISRIGEIRDGRRSYSDFSLVTNRTL